MDSFDSTLDLEGISINSLLNSTIDDIQNLKVSTDTLLQNQKFSCDNLGDNLIDKIIIHLLRHNLSFVCLEDLMNLLNINREMCDKLPTHKKQIFKMFRENRDLIEVWYFIRCNKCKRIVKKNSENMEQVKCCDEILKKTETNFFVYMPLRKQIIQSIENNWQYIKNFDTTSKDADYISDAHDGDILKDVLKQYENDDLNILSLCLNVDGANKFNSNLVSLWPIQFTQNYLPPTIRFQPHNILVSGLLYTEDKFDFREYLLPLVNELNNLKVDKISMNIEGEEYTFKPVITHCGIDLPAKSKLQETKQFGGYDACTYCEIPGELVLIKKSKDNVKKKNNNKKNQPCNEEKPKKFVRYVEGRDSYPLRDEKETLKKMLVASTSSAVDGIKDVSCLVAFEHFNIVDSVGVEYMHCVLLGVEKSLINFFCNPKYSNGMFYITKQKRKILNARILAIKPNSDVVRKPRSLELRSKFKASEFRSMLLYYFPVCLAGCVANVYVKHVRLLSGAIYILLQATIPRQEIDRAEEMLNRFVVQHQQLFGKANMVMNIHLLKHLAQSVRKLGPLWCFSAFPFERNNGVLMKFVNGTTDVLLQTSTKYCLSKSIINHHAKTNITEKILLGKSVKIEEKLLHVFNVETLKEVNLSNIALNVHKRINLKNVIYTSKLYTRPKKSIDYFLGLQNDMIGMAKFYFESNGKTFVVMEEFEIIDYINHILKVQHTRRNILAPITEIQKKYLYLKVGLNQYVSSVPNPYERE